MSTQTEDRKKQLRDEFIDARGYWNAFWDSLLDMDEDFFEAYTKFSSVPWRSGPLDPKIKEFVYIAVDAAATHLYAPGIRQHVKQALALGATAAEIMEVLELTATLGIHACNIGVPILVEETTLEQIRAAGVPEEMRFRRLACLRPYGMKKAVTVSEVLPTASGPRNLSDQDIHQYESALDAFNAGRWDEAYALLHCVPHWDQGKDFLLSHILHHRRQSPPGWQGVIEMQSK